MSVFDKIQFYFRLSQLRNLRFQFSKQRYHWTNDFRGKEKIDTVRPSSKNSKKYSYATFALVDTLTVMQVNVPLYTVPVK